MTIHHVLLECEKWNELRTRFLRKQGRRDLPRLLSTQKGCLAAARTVQETELLQHFKASDLERLAEGVVGEERRREV